MSQTPAPLRAVTAWAAPLSGAGTAGLGVSAVFTHSQTGLIIVAALIGVRAVTAGAARIFEAIYQRRPEIIKAKGEAHAARITAQGQADIQRIAAESEANALITRTATRSELLIAGAEPGYTESAAAMIRQQGADPDLPEGRRLNDVALVRLLTPPKPPTGGGKPRQGPAGAVVPITLRPLKAVRPPGHQHEPRELSAALPVHAAGQVSLAARSSIMYVARYRCGPESGRRPSSGQCAASVTTSIQLDPAELGLRLLIA